MGSRVGAVALLVLVGCAKDPESSDKGPPIFPHTGHTGDSGLTTPKTYIQPTAVGFELQAYVAGDGSLGSITFQGGIVQEPLVILTFADDQYFLATSDAGREGHYCIALAPFAVTPKFKPDQIPVEAGTPTLYFSYETALPVTQHNCGGVVDPDTWGSDASLLWGPFVGARFGYGFGPMTEFLSEQFVGGDFTVYEDNFFGNYIALNDKYGTFEAKDWTSAIVYEADPDTHEFILDGSGLPIPIDVSALYPGTDLPPGNVISYAYWFQDFWRLNFDNLTDGAPAP